MSKADGICECAAHSSSECVCGVWDDNERSKDAIIDAHETTCNCIDGSCLACKMFDVLFPKKEYDVRSSDLISCPFCGKYPIKFENKTTCECDNKGCPMRGISIPVKDWQIRR